MYGMLPECVGLAMYLFGVLLARPRHILGNSPGFVALNEWIVWYGGVPLMLGMSFALLTCLSSSTESVCPVRQSGMARSPAPD
jgi:hypothetical protein